MFIGAKVKITGDLERAERVTNPRFWRGAAIEMRGRVLRAIGEEYIKELRRRIESGDVEGPELSETWAQRKGDGRPWIYFADLVDALTVLQVGDGKFHAGIPRGALNREGQPLDLIAAALEIGTVDIPPRPVFEPTARSVIADQAWIGYQIESALQKVLR